MANILTTRDLKCYNFMEETNLYMTARQIAKMFYSENCNSEKSALLVAQRRLKIMVDKKYLKRIRASIAMEYIYFCGAKAPKKVDHKLTMSEFISNFSKISGVTVLDVAVEWDKLEKQYGLRPDLRLEFEFKNTKYAALIEIDLTKQFSNTDKYRSVIKAREIDAFVDYHLPSGRTFIISVCDKQPPLSELQPIWIKTNMDYFGQIEYRLNN